MVTCPLCEHPRGGGTVCDVCGALGAKGAPAVTVVPLPELEGTAHQEVPVASLSVEPLTELEATLREAEPEWPGDPLTDVVGHRLASAPGDAPGSDVLPELETHRAPEQSGLTGAPPMGAQACRYCRHVQPEGAFCERCGMRRSSAARPGPSPGASRALETTRCRACGAPALAGNRCGDCGQLVAAPER